MAVSASQSFMVEYLQSIGTRDSNFINAKIVLAMMCRVCEFLAKVCAYVYHVVQAGCLSERLKLLWYTTIAPLPPLSLRSFSLGVPR